MLKSRDLADHGHNIDGRNYRCRVIGQLSCPMTTHLTFQRVMTGNGSCYRSTMFNDALGEDVKHKYTRPYRLQTNGKIERFQRTLADERAHACHYDSRPATSPSYPAWLHHDNHHRPHIGI